MISSYLTRGAEASTQVIGQPGRLAFRAQNVWFAELCRDLDEYRVRAAVS